MVNDNLSDSWQHLYQHASHPHYLQSLTWHRPNSLLQIVTVDDCGVAVAGSLLTRTPIIGNRYAYYEAIRGPLFTNADALAQHLEQLKTGLPGDAIGVQVSPYIYRGDPQFNATITQLTQHNFQPVGEARNNLYTATPLVNLGQGLDSVRAHYRSSFKRQLKKANKDGIQILLGKTLADLESYIKGHTDANLARGAPPPNQAILHGWRQLFEQKPEQLRLSLANYRGVTIAGQVSVICGDRMIYEWGFSNSDDQFKNLAKSHLLHDAAIEHAIDHHLATYDLGGFWQQLGSNNSLNRFKLAITEQIEETLPKYEYLIRPTFHKAYHGLRNLIKRRSA